MQDHLNEIVGNSATLEKTATFIREKSIIQKGDQKQQQELTTSLATAAETMGTSQRSAAEGRPATAGMPEIVKMPTTVLAAENKEFFLCFILF